MRYLAAGLLVEGKDQSFLLPVVQRQLDRLGIFGGFEVGAVRGGDARTEQSAQRVEQAAGELLKECGLLIVHHDHRERAKVDTLRSRLACGSELVALVPVLETEAWILAAMRTLNVPGFRRHELPAKLKDLEDDPDPKATLRRLYTRGDPVNVFDLVGEKVDLDVLAALPSYGDFLQDLDSALKELRFL